MMLEMQLSGHIAIESPDFVAVHAGVVADGDRAIVMPGELLGQDDPGRALVEAGAVYYSDEYAMLDEAGRVHPYARQLSFRPPTGFQSSSCRAAGGVAGDGALPVGMVILTRYRPGGEWRPRQLSRPAPAEGHARTHHPRRGCDRAGDAGVGEGVNGAVTLEGERGEADEFAGVLLENLRAAA